MKLILASILLVLSITSAYCRKPSKLDSLKNVLLHLPAEGKSFTGDTLRVRVLCELGENYAKLNNDSAIVFSKNAIEIANKIHFRTILLKLYNQSGRFYLDKSLPTKSSEFFFKGLLLAEELKSNEDIIFFTKSIGGNYLELGDFNNALKYLNIHSNLCKRFKKIDDYLISLVYIGIVYFEKKDLKKSLYFFKKCEKESETINSITLKNVALINIAKVFVEMGRLNEALTIYKSSISVNDGYLDRTAFVSNEISKIYLIKNNNNEALFYGLLALKNTKITNPNTLKEVSLTLSTIYQALGNLKESLKYFKTYTKISIQQDSVKNIELVRFLNLDYKNEKQTVQISELNGNIKEKELRNSILLISALGILGFLIVVIYFNNSLKRQNKEIQSQKMQIEVLNLNLEEKVQFRTLELSEANDELIKKNFEITEALFKGQSQERKRLASELHDNLGSTISAIKWRLEALDMDNLSVKEQKIYAGIKEMTTNAYSEIRNISHNLLPLELEKNNLLGAIENLISNLNMNEKILFSFQSFGKWENIDKKINLVLYSYCLELINNIIKHSNATSAVIELKKSDNKVALIIKDDGVGITDNHTNAGFGISKIKERIDELNGLFTISTQAKWNTVVEINLAL
jgi:signal transduction histidine kinase